MTEDRIDWIANAHCPGGVAHPNNVKNAIREALTEAARATPADPEPIYQVRYFGSGDWRDVSEAEYQHARMHPDMRDRIVYAQPPQNAADHIAVSAKEIWEYSFVHSSALGRPDEKVTMLTYEKADAFRPECFDQKLVCSVGTFVAEVSQDSDGFKHIADVVELDDIPGGTRLYAITAGKLPAADHIEAQSVPLSKRLIAAIEGECDGLAITAEQASNILAYLQYGAPIDDVLKDAQRYRKLRNADIDSVSKGGVFAGLTPNNVVINGEDLDIAVDLLINAKAKS